MTIHIKKLKVRPKKSKPFAIVSRDLDSNTCARCWECHVCNAVDSHARVLGLNPRFTLTNGLQRVFRGSVSLYEDNGALLATCLLWVHLADFLFYPYQSQCRRRCKNPLLIIILLDWERIYNRRNLLHPTLDARLLATPVQT